MTDTLFLGSDEIVGLATPAAYVDRVVAGNVAGRTNDDEITVFDSGGTGIETVAAAGMLYERAREQGLGTTIDFAPASDALTGK